MDCLIERSLRFSSIYTMIEELVFYGSFRRERPLRLGSPKLNGKPVGVGSAFKFNEVLRVSGSKLLTIIITRVQIAFNGVKTF